MILINEELLWLTVVSNYKNNWVANVEIQTGPIPLTKYWKQATILGFYLKKNGQMLAFLQQTVLAFGRPFFFVYISILRLVVDLQGWQSKG